MGGCEWESVSGMCVGEDVSMCVGEDMSVCVGKDVSMCGGGCEYVWGRI